MLNDANVVPAPVKEDADESDQPLESAWTNIEDVLKLLVPAPRLELQSGRAGPNADLVHHLMNLAPDLLLELGRGRFETTKEMLEIFVELSEKFSNFENFSESSTKISNISLVVSKRPRLSSESRSGARFMR